MHEKFHKERFERGLLKDLQKMVLFFLWNPVPSIGVLQLRPMFLQSYVQFSYFSVISLFSLALPLMGKF